MVIVRLAGGLGNQMFQYAAGWALAHAWQTELKLDLSYLSGQSLRTYSLNGFRLQPHFASTAEVARLTGTGASRVGQWLFRWTHALQLPRCQSVLRQVGVHTYEAQRFGHKRDLCLIGYWQNEKYFAKLAEPLRAEFTLAQQMLPAHQALAEQIAATTSVGVHVRRGDYVSNPRTNRLHGVCSPQYYADAAQGILTSYPEAHFFVFTDDPVWVGQNLSLGGPMTIVGPMPDNRDYEDLHLLSHCEHFILANSTFSWWAVWLNGRADRVVYAPLAWFDQAQHDTRELIPATWRRL